MTEFIINPVSGKPIKRGGSTYIKLLQQGVRFGGNSDHEKFKTDKIICEIDGKTTEELDIIKKNFNDTNTEYCAHKGRGFLSNYLVKKRKKTTYASFGLDVARRSAPKIIEYINNLEGLEDISIESAIARIIDYEGQKLAKRFDRGSTYFLLQDNSRPVTEETTV